MANHNERLETIFALEFGQLLENYLMSQVSRAELTEIICSCLQLRSRQQLAQIFTGYDTPSTANIFELLRTINDPELTQRFLGLQTTLPNLAVSEKQQTAELSRSSKPKDLRPYWERGNSEDEDLRLNDSIFDELGDLELLTDLKFEI